jgi:hypothetical protein
MKYLLFILFPFTILFAQDRYGNAQNGVFDNNMDFFAMAKVQNKSNTNYIEGVKGSIYLFDTWDKCIIIPSNDTSNFAVPCNYNIYSDQFELKVDDDKYILNEDSIESIRIGQKIFKPSNNIVDAKYIQFLAQGDAIKVVRVFKAKIIEGQTSTLGLWESKLKVNEIDYFVMSDGSFMKVPSSKSKIFNILNLSQDQRKTYKKYNLKKTEELVHMIQSLQ